MNNKKIIVVGTSGKGGIKSVIESYEKSGFYSKNNMIFIASCSDTSLLKRIYLSLKAFIIILFYTLAGKVTLIHMHMSMRGSFFRKLIIFHISKLRKTPVILHLHGSEFKVFYNNSSTVLRKMIKYLFDSVSCVVVLSEMWKSYLSEITDAKIEVINNFVPDIYCIPDKDKYRYNILFLGEFGKRKGIYDLLDVFPDIASACPNVLLNCAGNGEIENVNKIIYEKKLSKNVKNHGWISGNKKKSIMNESSIFVLPSYNEGLPMSIIEAMSCSMAIVSTNVGGISELVNHNNGYLIEAGDKEKLKSSIIKLLTMEHVQFDTKCGQSRLMYEENYSPSASLQKMKYVYQSAGVKP
ncbi:MAG: glycosyltransferase family 4 protein [Candidatus Thiodiazotropha taylori]|nr:glycosyltransferase family 4 protein [Candidatus Thiodiazotropha taylori]